MFPRADTTSNKKTGKKILTASEDSTLILWDPRTGESVHKLTGADARFRLDGGINCLAINPASTVAIVGGAEGGLRAVNLVQGTVLAQMEGHEEGASIEQVAFNEIPTVGGASAGASVTVVVSVGVDGRVCTWEASGFKLRSTGSHEVSLALLLRGSAAVPRLKKLTFSPAHRTPSPRCPSPPTRPPSLPARRTRRSSCGTTAPGRASARCSATATSCMPSASAGTGASPSVGPRTGRCALSGSTSRRSGRAGGREGLGETSAPCTACCHCHTPTSVCGFCERRVCSREARASLGAAACVEGRESRGLMPLL